MVALFSQQWCFNHVCKKQRCSINWWHVADTFKRQLQPLSPPVKDKRFYIRWSILPGNFLQCTAVSYRWPENSSGGFLFRHWDLRVKVNGFLRPSKLRSKPTGEVRQWAHKMFMLWITHVKPWILTALFFLLFQILIFFISGSLNTDN